MRKSIIQNNRRNRILQHVLDKGFSGASIREICYELRESEGDVPVAAIISYLDRLVELGQLVEEREQGSHGYIRRFYDQRYFLNKKRS